MKILLGKNIIDKEVYWEIESEKNPHLIVFGTSGSGKTETLKAIVGELNKHKVPSLIIDFHNEYEEVAENILDLKTKTINPLELKENESPKNTIYEVSEIIKKVFKLGDIQESILRKAIRDSYLAHGIDPRKAGKYKEFPNFSDIEKNIYKQENNSNKIIVNSLISRIEPLFDMDIFTKNTDIDFTKLMNKTSAVQLKDFPTEAVKTAIAEFFLNKLCYFVYSLNKSKKIRLCCVIDEAHRLMYENSPLDKLLRESRKYGISVILASQRPSDFSETVLANSGALLSFQCSLEKDAKFVAKQFNLDYRKIKNLTEPGLGYVKFSRSEKPEKIKIIPLKERKIKKLKKEEAKKAEEPKKEKFRSLRRIFFYDNENFSLIMFLRVLAISLSVIFALWNLYFLRIKSSLALFILAFIWTPAFSYNLEIKKESAKLFNIFRFFFSCFLFLLFCLF